MTAIALLVSNTDKSANMLSLVLIAVVIALCIVAYNKPNSNRP